MILTFKKLGFAASLLCGLLGLTQAHATTARLTKVQSFNAGAYTRVLVSLMDAHDYRLFTLANPNRLVVDFSDTRMNTLLKNVRFSDGNFTQVRSGRPTPSVLRLVFDMTRPAHVKTFLASGNNHHEKQLVIDVYPMGEYSVKASSSVVHAVAKHAVVAKHIAVAKNVASPKSTLGVVRPIIIAIDPGHGGKDPGTVGANGTKEKTIVLDIALRLAAIVNKEPNMHAILTRQSDRFVSLRRRLDFARQHKADLFIAVHADSYLDDNSAGASIYALSRHGATTEAARWLARHENYSELGGVNFNGLGDQSYLLRSVLIDLAQTATIADSLRLGSQVLDALGKVTKLHYRRVEQAPFMVLKSPDIPSILVETGFLSNPKEEERLRTDAYRETLAQALLNGISRYVVTHPTMASNARPRILT